MTKLCLLQQNIFVTIKVLSQQTCLLQQNFVVTNSCLLRQIFVTTKMVLAAAPANDSQPPSCTMHMYRLYEEKQTNKKTVVDKSHQAPAVQTCSDAH